MKLSHPKAFTPFKNDKVHITVPVTTNGVTSKEECDIEVSIISGVSQMVGGAGVQSRQNGDHYSVFFDISDWNFSVPPFNGVVMESLTKGKLVVQNVQKTPSTYILDCVGKTSFAK